MKYTDQHESRTLDCNDAPPIPVMRASSNKATLTFTAMVNSAIDPPELWNRGNGRLIGSGSTKIEIIKFV